MIDLGRAEMRGWVVAEVVDGLGGATLSPDGRLVAFTTGGTSRSDLQIADLTRAFEGELLVPALSFGEVDQYRWSPASDVVYFSQIDGRRSAAPRLHAVTLSGEVTSFGIEGWPVAVVSR